MDVQCNRMKFGSLDGEGEYKESRLRRIQAHRSPRALGDEPHPNLSLVAHPGPSPQRSCMQPEADLFSNTEHVHLQDGARRAS